MGMMTRDHLASYVLCFLIIQVKLSNSRTSWRLNVDKVVKASNSPSTGTDFVPILEEEQILDILMGSATLDNGQGWSRSAAVPGEKIQVFCKDCQPALPSGPIPERHYSTFATKDAVENATNAPYAVGQSLSCNLMGQSCNDTVLDCGNPVNFTYYDNLLGVANRYKHPMVPEPNVILTFKRTEDKSIDLDIDLLERRLRRAKREKPKSLQLYNQIGNFWRIKGNTQRSIECFRRALAVSPYNAEVLLNLARVLLVLEYLDDASYLARRSLELQPPDRSAWEQYLTLGQIFKAYGHFQEAAVHLRHALELKPDLEDAAKVLKEVESFPIASIHVYTLLIILCLVLGVLLVVLSSVECEEDSTLSSDSQKRHFNRAMAMRSLRLNVGRNKRC